MEMSKTKKEEKEERKEGAFFVRIPKMTLLELQKFLNELENGKMVEVRFRE